MEILVYLCVFVFILVFIGKILSVKSSKKCELYSVPLLTSNESNFYNQLIKQYDFISLKVRCENVIKVKKGINYNNMRNQIKSRHFDFVIHDQFGNVQFIVELQDKTHSKDDRKKSDKLKNEICTSCNIKIYFVYNFQDFEKQLLN